jgi:anaerobic ribonucleoside-triphosphate reductase activating protein
MTPLALSRLHFPVTTLGPGARVGIWFQGCSIRCAGCVSADTWAEGRGKTTVEEVLATVAKWIPEADGFTLSGGEPFDQPDALEALLRAIRSRSNADILVYSGHAFEVIQPLLARMKGLIDALITDPYDISARQTLALRGSDNQRLHFLSALGRDRFAGYERRRTPSDKRFDLMMDASGEIWLAGIPGRRDFDRLSEVMKSRGHVLVTSQDRSKRARPNVPKP